MRLANMHLLWAMTFSVMACTTPSIINTPLIIPPIQDREVLAVVLPNLQIRAHVNSTDTIDRVMTANLADPYTTMEEYTIIIHQGVDYACNGEDHKNQIKQFKKLDKLLNNSDLNPPFGHVAIKEDDHIKITQEVIPATTHINVKATYEPKDDIHLMSSSASPRIVVNDCDSYVDFSVPTRSSITGKLTDEAITFAPLSWLKYNRFTFYQWIALRKSYDKPGLIVAFPGYSATTKMEDNTLTLEVASEFNADAYVPKDLSPMDGTVKLIPFEFEPGEEANEPWHNEIEKEGLDTFPGNPLPPAAVSIRKVHPISTKPRNALNDAFWWEHSASLVLPNTELIPQPKRGKPIISKAIGERECFQLVIRPSVNLKYCKVVFNDNFKLENAPRITFSPKNFTASIVNCDEFISMVPSHKLGWVGPAPNRLDELDDTDTFKAVKDRNTIVWICVGDKGVPPDYEKVIPGTYHGTVTVSGNIKDDQIFEAEIGIAVRIFPWRLPKERHFSLWYRPGPTPDEKEEISAHDSLVSDHLWVPYNIHPATSASDLTPINDLTHIEEFLGWLPYLSVAGANNFTKANPSEIQDRAGHTYNIIYNLFSGSEGYIDRLVWMIAHEPKGTNVGAIKDALSFLYNTCKQETKWKRQVSFGNRLPCVLNYCDSIAVGKAYGHNRDSQLYWLTDDRLLWHRHFLDCGGYDTHPIQMRLWFWRMWNDRFSGMQPHGSDNSWEWGHNDRYRLVIGNRYDGKVYSTVRLEMTREGLEDLEYLSMVRHLSKSIPPSLAYKNYWQMANDLCNAASELVKREPATARTVQYLYDLEKMEKIRLDIAEFLEDAAKALDGTGYFPSEWLPDN